MKRVDIAFAPLLVDYDEERKAKFEQRAKALWIEARDAIEARREEALATICGMPADRLVRQRAAIREAANTALDLAGRLHDTTIEELDRDGEISDATDRAWTALIDPEKAARLWPVENEVAA